jgi:hypothetical protein
VVGRNCYGANAKGRRFISDGLRGYWWAIVDGLVTYLLKAA